ncbi:thiaminase II [Alkalicoccobacillus murimartini]|uniref:Aminopyrimidine aminohydrolase n=1 Tax=Alkalicoccobacillus murimartini TaxID=171685 RepID=A0ABT9YCB0_9BACI|nr:thiaminase II [Alkalicoccobacillus murimartini]MDQ0205488.1 thiaminase/transcriptional activator TenA [Alkalicoccobacillus murimartini]
MSFTQQLRQKADSIWKANHEHPFVQEIGAGTLDLEAFKYYMKQDYLYLIEYSRVFALGAFKAPDLETMATFSTYLQSTLTEEMSLHRSYAKRLGITEDELEHAQPSPTTIAYSSYMISEAQKGSLAQLIAVILPCAWSYSEIGKKLAEIPGASEHAHYGEWIQMYQDDEFAAIAEWLCTKLDQLASSLNDREQEQLETIFITSSRFEYLFWEMSYHQTNWE